VSKQPEAAPRPKDTQPLQKLLLASGHPSNHKLLLAPRITTPEVASRPEDAQPLQKLLLTPRRISHSRSYLL